MVLRIVGVGDGGSDMSDMLDIDTDTHTIAVDSPFGRFTLDSRAAKAAIAAASEGEDEPLSPRAAAFQSHLGVKRRHTAMYWRPALGVLILSTLEDYIDHAGHTVSAIRRWATPLRGGRELSPANQQVRTGYDITKDVLVGGNIFLEACGTNLIITVSQDCDGDFRITVRYSAQLDGGSEFAKEWIGGLVDYFYSAGPLRGAVLDSRFRFLPRSTSRSTSVILPSEVRDQLERHLTGYIPVMEKLKARGLATNRGVILSGAPGTGKTMTLRFIIESTDLTTLVIPSGHLQPQTITETYRLARRLYPCLVLIEDIDGNGLHRSLGNNPTLTEILQALDGLDDNAGVVTVATTNFAEHLDDALRSRPGRFDRVIVLPIPDVDTRALLIQAMAQDFDITGIDPDSIASRIPGFSGDWIRSMLETATLICIQEGRKRVTPEDIDDAIADIDRHRAAAYVETPKLEPPRCSSASDRGSYV